MGHPDSFPQGLKPTSSVLLGGTTEVVPFQSSLSSQVRASNCPTRAKGGLEWATPNLLPSGAKARVLGAAWRHD